MAFLCRTRPTRPHSGASRIRSADKAPVPRCGVLLAGRYRLVERVGRGATADVWRAHDELLDRDVAIKLFRAHDPIDAEARLTTRVRHPNVVAVHDLVLHRGSACLVMDYHPGVSLAELLRDRHRLPPSVVAALGRQLSAALEAVHEAGVVHCDVKPANLMIADNGRLVLIDFGIAELGSGEPAHPARRTGDVVGSPAYTAPELVLGGTPRPASDLWSLGTVLFAAVQGRPPFLHEGLVPTLSAVLHDPLPPASRAGRLRPLVEQLLVKDPAARPSSAAIRSMLVEAYPASFSSTADVRDVAPRKPVDSRYRRAA
jgi:serine/threonine protein kinase